MVRIRLKIDSVDQSAFLLDPPDGEWEIDRRVGDIAQFSFELSDPNNELTLTGGKEVIVEKFTDSSTVYFGGNLTEIVDLTLGLGVLYRCKALGWIFDLSRTIVNQIYIGKSDQFIITDTTNGIFLGVSGDAVKKDLSSFTVTTANIEEGNSNTQKVVLAGETIPDIMDLLSDWAGFVWGVEPDKTVFYRPFLAGLNTLILSDVPDDVRTFGYYSFQRFRNFSEIVNAVYVYGGFFTVEDQTVNYGDAEGTDGTKTDFQVPQAWRAKDDATDFKVVVEKTDGIGGFDAQTVGFPQEVGTFDVVWHELTRTFFFAVAPISATISWRVNGNIYDRIQGEAFDDDSIAEVGQYEIVIKDSTLRDEDAVERRAEIELLKRSEQSTRITLLTTTDDFELGKMVSLINGQRSINKEFLIVEIIMRGLGGATTEYELALRAIPT